FENKQESPKPVQKRKSAFHPESKTRIDFAQQSSQARSQNKSDSESNPDHAERASAFFFWRYIGDVSHRCWNARCGDAGNDSTEKEPAQGRCHRHYDVVQTQSEIGKQNDRAPAK